jgi:hypothetical protein
MNRWGAALVSIGLVGATLEPIVRAPADDGFPLSTFPMFATPRPTQVVMSYAQGVTRDGRPRMLSPGHLGTGEVMQAFSLIQGAVAAGPRARLALCTAIAARVAGDAALRDVVAIQIVAGTHDAVDYFAGGTLGREVTQERCDVPRSTP